MDCRSVIFLSLAVCLTVIVTYTEGRTKKVVIHVPYKVKKIKHTHTVFKTVHHHHTHHDDLDQLDHQNHFEHLEQVLPSSEEHEHFHHIHIDEPLKPHTQPVPTLRIPEFLPDTPLDLSLELSNAPRDIPRTPKRRVVPFYKRNKTYPYFVPSEQPTYDKYPTLSSIF